MTQRWQIVLLGAIVSCGAELGAMEIKVKKGEIKKVEQNVLEQRTGLNCSAELRREKSDPVIIPALVNKLKNSGEQKRADGTYSSSSTQYYALYPGGPLVNLSHDKNNITYYMKPFDHHWGW